MPGKVGLNIDGAIAVITIDNPPVSAMDAAVRQGLLSQIAEVEADASVRAVVIAANGKTFVAGADLVEFDRGISEPGYRECFAAIENCSKPVIASLHGTVLGAGAELALACHYRIAQPSTRIGFPEMTLGVVPGAGGTQRLPRAVGGREALSMLLVSTPIDAQSARDKGLIDAIVEGDPVACGITFVEQHPAARLQPRRTCDGMHASGPLDEAAAATLLESHARALKGRATQHQIIRAVLAAGHLSFEAGLDLEKSLSDESLASSESLALRHMFFAERKSASVPGTTSKPNSRKIKKVAVVGAGTMGSGIAVAFAQAEYDVALVDGAPEGLERGRGIIRSAFQAEAKRGRLTSEQAEKAAAAIRGTLDLRDIADADLVIEAVFEDMAIKKKVLSDIDAATGPETIIASNTSSLSVAELGAATRRPEKVVGLHFFSPAHVMKLLEVVRSDATSSETLAASLEVAKRIRKVPVVSGDGFGFIGNRMMLDGAFREAEQMLLEGAKVDQVDRAVEAFGFAMGPSRVNDMAGVDIGTLVRRQLALRASRPDPYCVVSDALTLIGRVGQKSGLGFYSYKENPRVGAIDAAVTALIEKLAGDRGIVRRNIGNDEIVERFVLQLVNVGADILAEGIAYRAADIDVVWVHGYGFPRHLGGPMFYADLLGLEHVLTRVRYWQERFGNYWKPSPLLERLVSAGSSFAAFDRSNALIGT